MSSYEDRLSDFKIHNNTLLKYTGGADHVIIPEGITDIGTRVFMERSMISVEFPASLEFIGKNAFHGCAYLESVTLPDGVQIIGEDAFCDCGNLTELTLPSQIEELQKNAFFGCSFVKEVVIPEGIRRLEDGIFQCCMSLEKITIPDSVTAFGDDPFGMCTSLATVVCKKNSITDYYFQMLKHEKIVFEYTGQSKHALNLGTFFA